MTRFDRVLLLETARLTMALACIVAQRFYGGQRYPDEDFVEVFTGAKQAMIEWKAEFDREQRESAADKIRRQHT